MVCELKPHYGLAALSAEPASDPLSSSPSSSPTHSLSLKDKLTLKKKKPQKNWDLFKSEIYPKPSSLWIENPSHNKVNQNKKDKNQCSPKSYERNGGWEMDQKW